MKTYSMSMVQAMIASKDVEQFDTSTAQGLFLCKCGTSDSNPAIAHLLMKLRNKWIKPVRKMIAAYLRQMNLKALNGMWLACGYSRSHKRPTMTIY